MGQWERQHAGFLRMSSTLPFLVLKLILFPSEWFKSVKLLMDAVVIHSVVQQNADGLDFEGL